MLHLVAEIEHVAVIEGHVVTITTEDNKMILEDHACVTVPGNRPLPFDVEDLGLVRTAHHGRAVRVTRSTVIPTTSGLSLAHVLIVGVVIRGLMILDKEGLRHSVRCRRIQPDLTLVFERLSLLQESESIHWSHSSLSCALTLLIGGVHGFRN